MSLVSDRRRTQAALQAKPKVSLDKGIVCMIGADNCRIACTAKLELLCSNSFAKV
jgi:hypothetical protein